VGGQLPQQVEIGGGQGDAFSAEHKTISFGSLTIDPVNRQVLLGGESVALSTADFDLLWEGSASKARLYPPGRYAGANADAVAPAAPPAVWSSGSLTIDPVNRQVLLGGESVALSTADFDLLWELATQRYRAVFCAGAR
jgi:DNA-binding response OmpR family regulator